MALKRAVLKSFAYKVPGYKVRCLRLNGTGEQWIPWGKGKDSYFLSGDIETALKGEIVQDELESILYVRSNGFQFHLRHVDASSCWVG